MLYFYRNHNGPFRLTVKKILVRAYLLQFSRRMDEEKIWNALGAAGFEQIAAAFYQGVRRDSLIGPMYPPDDWEGAEHRFATFLKFRFGQDETYLKERGHPRLRGRHMPFAIGEAERDRWLVLMKNALESQEVEEEIAGHLMAFFAGVADFMRNQ